MYTFLKHFYVFIFILIGTAYGSFEEEVMPLESLKKGVQGFWKTKVEGDAWGIYDCEFLGVTHDFRGIGYNVLWFKGLDADQVEKGSVSGMSGSPVYVENKLVGAYAYGFSWPKNEAKFGVTPIGNMLPLLDLNYKKEKKYYTENEYALRDVFLGDLEKDSIYGEKGLSVLRRLFGANSMFSLGISKDTFTAFNNAVFGNRHEFKLNFMNSLETSYQVADVLEEDFNFEGGSSVYVYLVYGDLTFGALGTVTWTDGESFLAYGHPFMNLGDVEFPAGGGEVITIIQSMEHSFKLGNPGALIGSVYQDRNAGIAGRLGEKARTIDCEVFLELSNKDSKRYELHFVEDRFLTPYLMSVSMFRILEDRFEKDSKKSYGYDVEIEMEGLESIHINDYKSGPNAEIRVAISLLEIFAEIYMHPFPIPKVTAVRVKFLEEDGWRMSGLVSVQFPAKSIREGELLRLPLVVHSFEEKPQLYFSNIKFSEPGEDFSLFVGNGKSLFEYEGRNVTKQFGSFESVIKTLNRQYTSNKLYVRLFKEGNRIMIDGYDYDDVSSTFVSSYLSPSSISLYPFNDMDHTPLRSADIVLPAEVFGSIIFKNITVLPQLR